MNGGAARKEIALQCGIARETRIFEAKDLATLTELACGFVDFKVYFERLFEEVKFKKLLISDTFCVIKLEDYYPGNFSLDLHQLFLSLDLFSKVFCLLIYFVRY